MKIEYYEKPEGYIIPAAEIRRESDSLFARYDIGEQEKMENNERNEDKNEDSNMVRLVASYIRVPYPVTEGKVAEACEANECEHEHALEVAAAIMDLYKG